ncbi:Quinate/shikimate 5-dehydrogenase/glutamyl-tRNA reductase [Candidatus Methylopumilus universalis]
MDMFFLDEIEKKLLAMEIPIYIILATTANKNNPSLYVSALRTNKKYAAANFIFSDDSMLKEVIRRFDGVAHAFIVDVELKNQFKNLEKLSESFIKKSKIYRFKPNDITVFSLDLLLSAFIPCFKNKISLIVGPGNIGVKTAIVLAERGCEVKLLGREYSKIKKIAEGVSEIIRGSGSISAIKSISALADVSLILGCSPGIPVISSSMIQNASEDALVIDVGNGTIQADALLAAEKRNINIICLTVEIAFFSWLEAIENTKKQVNNMVKRVLPSGLVIIGPGVYGSYGDVIVDNPNKWEKIIGVCDGKGDILHPELSKEFLLKLEA